MKHVHSFLFDTNIHIEHDSFLGSSCKQIDDC